MTDLPLLRWSATRECARQAVYQATGAPARPRTRQEEGWLWRGRQLGRDFALALAAQEKAAGNRYRIYVASGLKTEWPNRWRTPHRDQAAFVVEQPIPWPFGIMHADIYVMATDTIIEVLSSANASGDMVAGKLLQLTGQMWFGGYANGAVVVVDPSNPLDTDVHPLHRSSQTFRDLRDEVLAKVGELRTWAAEGTLPARVCGKPADARSHFCPHADHCFADWEAPPADVVFDEPEALQAAARLYRAKQAEHEAKFTYDVAVSARREAEQRLEQHLELAAHESGKIAAGPLEINRIVVKPRTEFKLAKARTAGVWTDADEERFQMFLGTGGGHVRYSIDRVSDAPIVDEVPEIPGQIRIEAA